MKDHMGAAPENAAGIHSNAQNRMSIKASSPHAVKQLQLALQQGSMVFCENSGEVTN